MFTLLTHKQGQAKITITVTKVSGWEWNFKQTSRAFIHEDSCSLRYILNTENQFATFYLGIDVK